MCSYLLVDQCMLISKSPLIFFFFHGLLEEFIYLISSHFTLIMQHVVSGWIIKFHEQHSFLYFCLDHNLFIYSFLESRAYYLCDAGVVEWKIQALCMPHVAQISCDKETRGFLMFPIKGFRAWFKIMVTESITIGQENCYIMVIWFIAIAVGILISSQNNLEDPKIQNIRKNLGFFPIRAQYKVCM